MVDLKIVDFLFYDCHLEQVSFGWRGLLVVLLFGVDVVVGLVFEFFELLSEFGEFKGGVDVSDVLGGGYSLEPVGADL